MHDEMLTHAILTRTTVPFRRDSEGLIYLEVTRVLQKGTLVLLDNPFDYTHPVTGETVRLVRFKTNHGPHEEMAHLGSGLYLSETLLSYTVINPAST